MFAHARRGWASAYSRRTAVPTHLLTVWRVHRRSWFSRRGESASPWRHVLWSPAGRLDARARCATNLLLRRPWPGLVLLLLCPLLLFLHLLLLVLFLVLLATFVSHVCSFSAIVTCNDEGKGVTRDTVLTPRRPTFTRQRAARVEQKGPWRAVPALSATGSERRPQSLRCSSGRESACSARRSWDQPFPSRKLRILRPNAAAAVSSRRRDGTSPSSGPRKEPSVDLS